MVSVALAAVVALSAGPKHEPVRMSLNRLEAALLPSRFERPIIPTPKQSLFKKNAPMVLGEDLRLDLPDRLYRAREELVRNIRLWWDVDIKADDTKSPRIYCRIQDLNLPAEGYELRIDSQTALIMGQDEAGLRHALRTLAQLVYLDNGRLCLPNGLLRDWPSMPMRAVHLFVGKESVEFHRQMWERVLAPLKFNTAVVQCQRTDWACQPKIKGPMTMSRDSLVNLFEQYRGMGVEPIPLIQSFGHMGWLFENGENLHLAMNPENPFAIDPRKPEAQKVVAEIWAEAIKLLKPKTIHFGLDEVDTRGVEKNPKLVTELWEKHLPFLGSIAAKHNVNMMLWGDKCLAPGEAIDAALGDTPQDAQRRRAALPKGIYIADWHYRNDPKPDRFFRSLRLWQREGFKPIACTWWRPENIRGFYLAAIQSGAAGTLQTTWAGHESNEFHMLREFKQFSAMVVSADYAWSGRTTAWNDLGYDANEVFSRLFYSWPSPTRPVTGVSLGDGSGAVSTIGDVNFRFFAPLSLAARQDPLVVSTDGLEARTLAFAWETAAQRQEGDPVARLDVLLDDGRTVSQDLVYGKQVRARFDGGFVPAGRRQDGVTAFRLVVGENAVGVKQVTLTPLGTNPGLRVHGITAF